MLRKLIATVPALALLAIPAIVSAHVIVTPGQVGVAAEQVFNISVPNEQQTPVTSIKLNIPTGVTNVTPTVANGWTITTTDNGDAKNPEVTSITWTGNIPVGQREDFSFGAQVPGQATELDWKAYQTYGDGTVVHWDQKPAGSDDSTGNAGPYSVTKVVNDLTTKPAPAKSQSNALPTVLSLVALVVSAYAVLTRKK